jgi:circadian clock protein KaiB
MKAKPRTDSAKTKIATSVVDQSAAGPGRPQYGLRLYVAGMTPRSAHAIANIKEICEEHLKGRFALEVIDIYQQPLLAEGELPPPLRRLIGDLSDRERVLIGLDLKPRK